MAQVKFYAKAAMPSENIDQDGIYFITTGGEIYKGATRFGCGRVTKASTAEELAALTGMARGDINVGYEGAKVFDGTSWASLAASGGSVDPSQWQADISTWTAGLVAGGTGSIITQITQAADGKVTASASPFPTLATGDADGQVKLGTQNAKVSGWDALVSKVDGFASIIDVSTSAVSAVSGTFTDLTVTSTATFSVTNVSASSLTIGGSTVEQIADAQIAAIASATVSSSSGGIEVAVTTAGGSVTDVVVNATSFGNVMKFRGVYVSTGAVSDPAAGDIIVIGPPAATGFKVGQEYICTDIAPYPKWELIGDQNSYALNAYAPGTEVVTAGTTTLPGAVHAIASAFDSLGAAAQKSVATSVAAVGADNDLPTCSAVKAYVSDELTSFISSPAFVNAVTAAVSAALTWITE